MLYLCKEPITDFGVKKIIRVGSCGAVRQDVKLRDVVIGLGACTDSKVNRMRFKGHDYAAIADFNMVCSAVQAASEHGISTRLAIYFLQIYFIHLNRICSILWKIRYFRCRNGGRGIYAVAAEYGARALTICTVSDHIRTNENYQLKNVKLRLMI